MHHSEGITNDLALERAIEEIKKPKDKVEIDNFPKKGKQVIYVKIGSKKFSGIGETRSLSVKSVTEKIQNYKPAVIKRRIGKIMNTVKNAFKRA